MFADSVSSIDEFYPLLIRCCAPALKPFFVKYTNNFINWVFLFIVSMDTA